MEEDMSRILPITENESDDNPTRNTNDKTEWNHLPSNHLSPLECVSVTTPENPDNHGSSSNSSNENDNDDGPTKKSNPNNHHQAEAVPTMPGRTTAEPAATATDNDNKITAVEWKGPVSTTTAVIMGHGTTGTSTRANHPTATTLDAVAEDPHGHDASSPKKERTTTAASEEQLNTSVPQDNCNSSSADSDRVCLPPLLLATEKGPLPVQQDAPQTTSVEPVQHGDTNAHAPNEILLQNDNDTSSTHTLEEQQQQQPHADGGSLLPVPPEEESNIRSATPLLENSTGDSICIQAANAMTIPNQYAKRDRSVEPPKPPSDGLSLPLADDSVSPSPGTFLSDTTTRNCDNDARLDEEQTRRCDTAPTQSQPEERVRQLDTSRPEPNATPPEAFTANEVTQKDISLEPAPKPPEALASDIFPLELSFQGDKANDEAKEGEEEAKETEPLFSRTEFWFCVCMCIADSVTCIVSYFMSFLKVECCGDPDALSVVGQIGFTTIFLIFVIIDMVLLIRRRSFFLTIFNPAFGYIIAIMMLFSGNPRSAVITLVLTIASFLFDTWTLFKLFKETRDATKDAVQKRRGVLCLKQVLYVAVAIVNAYLGWYACTVYFDAITAGGVCIHRITLPDGDSSNKFHSEDSQGCEICPDGSVVNSTYRRDPKNFARIFSFNVSNCPGEETYGTYCGSSDGGNYTGDFCFLEW